LAPDALAEVVQAQAKETAPQPAPQIQAAPPVPAPDERGPGRPIPVADQGLDMLTLLKQIALGIQDATPNQVRAAIAAVQYTHAKVGEGGKKDEKQRAAERVAGGKFSAASAPNVTPIKRAQG